MNTKKQEHNLPDVYCEVASCIYNSEAKTCHAEHIQVESQIQESKTETDTCCGTFLAR